MNTDTSTILISTMQPNPDDTDSTNLFWDGFYAYRDGIVSWDALTTTEQRRGWVFANRCQSHAEYDADVDYIEPSIQ